jgi:hypothetical protein
VVEAHAHRARFQVAPTGGCRAKAKRPPMTSIVWTRNCSALETFALKGVAL